LKRLPYFLLHFLLLLGLAAVCLVAVPSTAQPPSRTGYRPDTVLVAFKSETPHAARLQAVRRHGLEIASEPQSRYVAKLRIPPGLLRRGVSVKSVLDRLRKDPTVRVAEPDHEHTLTAIPNDPRFGELWGLHNTGQSGGTPDADIDAPEAWEITTGSEDVVVAVIDTGVDYNHPDLTENILRDGDGNVVGYDYRNNDADPMDDHDHGTHCAGTIGARGNNGIGVTGVTHRVKIMPLKFLGADGFGSTSAAIQCIDFAREHGAHIMSNSWGGDHFSILLLEAIQRARDAGILFVAGAGNDGRNSDRSPFYPANYNQHSDNVISVANSTRNDTLSSTSNFGANTVDIAAPGHQILSTVRGGGYASFSGTSMACPHVAGAAALLLSRYPAASSAELKLRLLANVDQPVGLEGKVATGRLNVHTALEDDGTPPGTPTNFQRTQRATTALGLRWTASGDDGLTGSAYQFDLRYSTTPIDAAGFAAAARAPGLPVPAPSGSTHDYLLMGLSPDTRYYLALRAIDNVGNLSELATLGPVGTLAVPADELCLLEEDVEGAPLFSGDAPWAVTEEQAYSPTHSYTDSPGAQYANNRNISLTQNSSVSLENLLGTLTFWARTDLEDRWDFLNIEASGDDGATWQLLLRLTGTSGWTPHSLNLYDYLGGTVRVRFRLITDLSGTADGVWLDDIRICGERLQDVTGPDAAVQFGASEYTVTEADGSASVTLTRSGDTSLPASAQVTLTDGSASGGLDYTDVSGVFTFAAGQSEKTLAVPITADNLLEDDETVNLTLSDPDPGTTTLGSPSTAVLTIRDDRARTAPGALAAAADSQTSIVLTWTDNCENEEGFEIWRKTGTGGYAHVGAASANETTFRDAAGLLPETEYRYRVRAVRGSLASDFSGEANAATDAATGDLIVQPVLNFHPTRVGTSQAELLTVRNGSKSGWLRASIQAPGAPFELVAGGGTVLLPPGGSHTIELRCTPSKVGIAKGVLEVASSDPSPPRKSVILQGTGLPVK
jgi:subtilisin family serine protease